VCGRVRWLFLLTWDAVQQVELMFGIRVVACLMYCRHRHDEHGWTFDCERLVISFRGRVNEG
jgi:hypothetical protein